MRFNFSFSSDAALGWLLALALGLGWVVPLESRAGVTPPPAPPPPEAWADAGPNRSVNEGSRVRLSGSGLGDKTWSQTSGPRVRLSSTSSSNPAFTAPQVSSSKNLVFQLSTRHTRGGTTPVVTTASDTVAITVRNVPASTGTQTQTGNGNGTVGSLPGTLAVDQTGSALYTIPIEVPPGTAGMEPSLSFNYNSNGGNGLLGVGWSLGGLSAIVRCPRTQAQDGVRGAVQYDRNDRFCLDGQRLVAIIRGTYGFASAEYRTEIDGFAKVHSRSYAGSGPQYFEARTKSGQLMEYGRTSSSRVEAAGTSEVRQWLLNRITDTAGNYLTISYREEGGHAYPLRIDYSGYKSGSATRNPYASVRFSYATRHDIRLAAVAGRRIRMTKRLTQVRTYVGSTLVSDYRLQYSPAELPQPSRVVAIQRCDGAGNCLSSTDFSWRDVGTGRLGSAAKSDSGFYTTSNSWSTGSEEVFTGDFNGDGISDLLWEATPASSRYRNSRKSLVALGAGSGTFGQHYSGPGLSYQNNGRLMLGDFNGDGRTDIARADAGNDGLRVNAALSSGSYFSGTKRETLDSRRFSSEYTPTVGDFNGDGRADIAWTYAGSSGLQAWATSSDGDGTFTRPQGWRLASGRFSNEYLPITGDFNGDGKTDLAWTRASSSGLQAWVALSKGGGKFTSAQKSTLKYGSFSNGYLPITGDFNGDGRTDLAWTRASSSGLQAWVALSDGDRTFASVQSAVLRSGNYSSAHKPKVGDFNGDGLTDLAWADADSYGLGAWVALSDGDGAFAIAQFDGPRRGNFSGAYQAVVGDFNGDGVADLSWSGEVQKKRILVSEEVGCAPISPCINRTYKWQHSLIAYTAKSSVPADHGRIFSIRSDLDARISLDYALLTTTSAYTRDSGSQRCSYPCLDVQGPLYVVTRATQDYGGYGLRHYTSYEYGGAKANLDGRGFLGFRWIRTTNGKTGIRTLTRYSQSFPYIGQVVTSRRYLPSGSSSISLGEETNTWTTKSLHSGKTRFPYISRSVAKTYELTDGRSNRPVATVTTTSRYDSYGNPTSLAVSTVGAGGTYGRTTTNVYTNDTTRWYLGRLTCSTVASSAPNRPTRTRRSGFAYDLGTGLLKKEVIEPGSGDISGCVSAAASADITLTTTHTYDKYGNRKQTTLSGSGVTSRTTRTKWGERNGCGAATDNGRFPYETRNALNHVTRYWHSALHGGETKRQNPNNLETRWEYDGFGRLIREARADGTQTITTLRSCADRDLACPSRAVRAVTAQSTGGAETTRYFDRRGLELRTETEGFNGTVVRQDTGYDSIGQVTSRSLPYTVGHTARWSRYVYDKAGRVTRETQPNGARTDTYYDGLVSGRVRERILVRASSTAAARTTTREYDALGQLWRVTDPNGTQTSHNFNAEGHLWRITDSAGKYFQRTEDRRGRIVLTIDPDRGTLRYRYNVFGELTRQANARGQAATMSYDQLGRLVSRVDPEGTTTWTYDAASTGKGRLQQVSGPDGYLRVHSYDTKGRPSSETVTIAAETFTVSRTYDAAGRVATITYPGSFSVQHEYNAYGYLQKVRAPGTSGTAYWTATAVNAAGQVTGATLGNGVRTTRAYDPRTGLVQSIQSSLGTTAVQNLTYAFDGLGNLKTREDKQQNVYESFTYDPLNRLTEAALYAKTTRTRLARKTYAYSNVGNITKKSDVGTTDYTYGTGNARGTSDAGPHAVTSAGGQSYTYDDDGNMLSGAGRTLTWTSFNKPKTIANATTTSTFHYGPNRARTRQTVVQGSTTTTIKYVAGLYEQVSKTGASTRHVHYVFAGGTRVAIRTTSDVADSSPEWRYLHHDHLGSVDVVTNASGAVQEQVSFDAYGKRRVAQGTKAWQDSTLALSGTETRRGFTDHEHLDDFGLVHMNGRVYDPHLGRFLSADPTIQSPQSTQGLNRYTYVGNNPLSFTDPSGYFIKGFFRKIKRVFRKVLGHDVVRIGAAAAFAVYLGPYGADLFGVAADTVAASVANGAFGGFGAGLIASGGDLRSAFLGGLSGAGFGFVGGHAAFGSATSVARVVAHGVVGGLSSELAGGKFGPGFFGAGFAKFVSPVITTAVPSSVAARVVAAAVVGGTASAIAGGKFANGAASAAFGRLFNAEATNRQLDIAKGVYDNADADLNAGLTNSQMESSTIRGYRRLLKAEIATGASKVGLGYMGRKTRLFRFARTFFENNLEDLALQGNTVLPGRISLEILRDTAHHVYVTENTYVPPEIYQQIHKSVLNRHNVPLSSSLATYDIFMPLWRWEKEE